MKRCTLVAVVLLTVLFRAGISPAGDRSLRLNCLERNWYPFLYMQDEQVRGLFYDIVSKAFESLKIKILIEPVPFRRALLYVRKGKTDGIIAVGFQPDLLQLLDYPPGADKDTESPWRIMQVDHVVVSFAEDNYTFEGDLKTLPVPVRVLRGDPIIDDLNKAGRRMGRSKRGYSELP